MLEAVPPCRLLPELLHGRQELWVRPLEGGVRASEANRERGSEALRGDADRPHAVASERDAEAGDAAGVLASQRDCADSSRRIDEQPLDAGVRSQGEPEVRDGRWHAVHLADERAVAERAHLEAPAPRRDVPGEGAARARGLGVEL